MGTGGKVEHRDDECHYYVILKTDVLCNVDAMMKCEQTLMMMQFLKASICDGR